MNLDSQPPSLSWMPDFMPGESLLWRGKPVRWRYALKDAGQSLMGLLMGAFVVWWYWAVFRGAPDTFPSFDFESLFTRVLIIVAIPHSVSAIYSLGGHYVWNWVQWLGVEYFVTTERALIKSGIERRQEVSLFFAQVLGIVLKAEREAKVGTLHFLLCKDSKAHERKKDFRYRIRSWFGAEDGEFAFHSVEAPHPVYRLIFEQRTRNRK